MILDGRNSSQISIKQYKIFNEFSSQKTFWIHFAKVTRPCIPPHGFFSSQFDVFYEQLILERPNSSLRNPCGGIHDLVTFSGKD